MQGNFLSFIAKVWQKMVKAKIPTIILHENTGILNVIAHLQSYSSGNKKIPVDCYVYLVNFKSTGRFRQFFLAFLENLNFTYLPKT